RIRGIRIAILAYTEVRKGFTYTRIPLEWRAGTNRPGVNSFDLQRLREDLAQARRMADHVVVLCHWGDEYAYRPNDFQSRMAQTMLDHGADLVIGHHPHVVQGVVFDKRGVIAYSLGNFVFDQYPRSCREGLICKALVDRANVIQVRFIPVLIEDERPRLLRGEAARKIIRQMEILSKGLDKELERGDNNESHRNR
ncbi:MAG TPA: CapA family protein, partial [Bacillota bacterium]|nr:CapA family protein [Bacillota bacterium]